jgi:hypothetical protein
MHGKELLASGAYQYYKNEDMVPGAWGPICKKHTYSIVLQIYKKNFIYCTTYTKIEVMCKPAKFKFKLVAPDIRKIKKKVKQDFSAYICSN